MSGTDVVHKAVFGPSLTSGILGIVGCAYLLSNNTAASDPPLVELTAHDPERAVSQFRELCEIADRDRSLTDTLKKVLKLSKGWETAREHVYKAVGTDNRMRCAAPLGCRIA